jgi:hypothetical protein
MSNSHAPSYSPMYQILILSFFQTSRYDKFYLGTLLVVGAAEEGQPVAFFVVGSESELDTTPVFSKFKERHPTICPKFFMSDAAEAFWNSWKAVFDVTHTKRVICS